jgi:integrase
MPDAEKARRGRGEGSITKRPDGKWEARATIAPGKRTSVYGRTKAEAMAKLRAAVNAAERGEPKVDNAVTVATLLADWMLVHRRAIRESTARRYDALIALHIGHKTYGVGTRKLAALQPEHVDRMIEGMAAAGSSPRTQQMARATLVAALNWAEKRKRVTHNAARLSEPPKQVRHEIIVWTPEQATAFLAGVARDRREALYVLAIDSGLRQGELLGLRWQDVDLDGSRLRVVQSRASVTKTGQTFTEPKSATSRRTVELSATTVAGLKRHKAAQATERLAAGKRWQPLDLVFVGPLGVPLNGSSVGHRFQLLVSRLELPRQRFHDLRHLSATMLLTQGMTIRAVADRLGHATPTLTQNLYGHAAANAPRQAADIMERVFGMREG